MPSISVSISLDHSIFRFSVLSCFNLLFSFLSCSILLCSDLLRYKLLVSSGDLFMILFSIIIIIVISCSTGLFCLFCMFYLICLLVQSDLCGPSGLSVLYFYILCDFLLYLAIFISSNFMAVLSVCLVYQFCLDYPSCLVWLSCQVCLVLFCVPSGLVCPVWSIRPVSPGCPVWSIRPVWSPLSGLCVLAILSICLFYNLFVPALEKNDLGFVSDQRISVVDIPILILHAK